MSKEKKRKSKETGELVTIIPGIEFMTVLDLLNVLVADATITFSSNQYMESKVVDSSHVCMLKIEHGIHDDKAANKKLCFDLALAKKYMKKAKWGKTTGRGNQKTYAEQLNVIHDENRNYVGVNTTVDGMETVGFEVKLPDPATMATPPRLPKLDLPAQVKISGQEFLKRVEMCREAGDLMFVEIEDEQLVTYTKNSNSKTFMETKNATAKYEGGKSRAQYSLTYLHPIAKALKNQEITIKTGDNYPVLIECDWDFGYETSTMKVQYFLAPRVESDY